MKVDLNDVIECIEYEGELLTHYYNKKTGIIIYVEDDSTSSYKAEDVKELHKFEEWERELINTLNDFKVNPQDYIQLPSKEQMDEFSMMIDFCNTLENSEVKENLLKSSKNKDSFRKLREAIESNGLLNQWYDYREDAEKHIAMKWCKDNNIEF